MLKDLKELFDEKQMKLLPYTLDKFKKLKLYMI